MELKYNFQKAIEGINTDKQIPIYSPKYTFNRVSLVPVNPNHQALPTTKFVEQPEPIQKEIDTFVAPYKIISSLMAPPTKKSMLNLKRSKK